MDASVAAYSRSITVFLSSPGDVRPEIDLIDNVVRDLDACMQYLGVTIRSWRYERNAPPGVGVDAQAVLQPYIGDYDVYVGLMRHRLGTPTQRADSGTLDEFQDARRRREQTGRPAVFFYFSSDALDCSDPQSAAVSSFRASYPGLFREFSDGLGLAATVKQDLLLWLTQEVLSGLRRGRRPFVPPWLATVEMHQPAGGSATSRSLRMIHRIQDAFPIAELFDIGEQEILLAAAFSLSGALEASAFDHSLAAMAERVVTESRSAVGEAVAPFHDDRTAALAGVLAIADLLEQERSALNHRGQVPAVDAAFEDWVRFLTREIRVRPGGFVQYVLEVPRFECINALKCLTSLRLETLWQRLRSRLAPLGIGLTVIPSEILLSPPGRQIPQQVLARLSKPYHLAIAAPPILDHLGHSEAPPLAVAALLPLPGTTVAGVLEFFLESPRKHVLEIFADGAVVTRLQSSTASAIALDTRTLVPGAQYEWVLYGIGAAGFSRKVRGGIFVVASPAAANLCSSIRSTLPEQYGPMCRQLGMHDEVMRILWDRLGHSDTPVEDRMWAYERLLHALEFSLDRYPQLTQVDAYRSAAGWLLSSLREGEHQ